MARQFFIPAGVMPLSGVMIDEDGTEEYFIPALGMFNEDQAAAADVFPVTIHMAPYQAIQRRN